MNTLALASLGLGALCLAGAVAAHQDKPHAASAAPVASTEEALPLPNLPVTDRFGVKAGFRDSIPATEALILSFTYTACDTLCDVSNALLKVVDRELGSGPERDATIVTVAIDAVRDTPQALQAAAEQMHSGSDWLWLTGGPRGTRPLLSALRFPPGALEAHDPMFLVGRPCNGRFTRVVGLADPSALVQLLRAQPRCES